jgi:hypothetical protein
MYTVYVVEDGKVRIIATGVWSVTALDMIRQLRANGQDAYGDVKCLGCSD